MEPLSIAGGLCFVEAVFEIKMYPTIAHLYSYPHEAKSVCKLEDSN